MKNSDLYVEMIGEYADRVDNLLSAGAIPLPEPMRSELRTEALRTLRDDLRAAYIKASGNNPWASHPNA